MSPGPAIIVENHLSGWDPFVTVMGTRWRVSAVAKIELFRTPVVAGDATGRADPIERGDEPQTEWVLATARWAIADGMKVGFTRRARAVRTTTRCTKAAPAGARAAHPAEPCPVHAVTVRYFPKGWRTWSVVSDPLPIDREAR